MDKKIEAKDLFGEDKIYFFNVNLPHICPRCNYGATFLVKNAYVNKSVDYHIDDMAYIFYLCPVCEKIFIGEYQGNTDTCGMDGYLIQEIDILPQTYDADEKQFTKEISELTPRFVNIYLQASRAEKMGLAEICGLGYRKALEVLVKEYAIYKNPEDEDLIIEYMLGKCIEEYFKENKKLYVLAKASTWLGNDEAHYSKKHENYGIDDMKAFIDVLISYIDSELKYDKAKRLIDKS